VNEIFLVAGDALQDPEVEQCATYGDQVPPFGSATERELEATRDQRRVGCQLHQAFSEQLQGDLRISSFEYGTRKAEQDIAVPVVVRQPARIVREVRGPLEEPSTLALDVQRPAGLSRKPVAQSSGLATYRREGVVIRRHQRLQQQGAQCSAELVVLLDTLELTDSLTVVPP
jgi:hypothetical protein